MNVIMLLLVAVLTGLVAEYAMKRGGYGLGWDIALGLTGSGVVSAGSSRAGGALPSRARWP
jgi:uncharacterized membrane protein YeaQ/YmgE (transglycosylase-associated protein family)